MVARKKTTKQSAANNGRTPDGKFAKGNPHAWPKGKSANPSGRPPDTVTPHLRARLKEQYPGKDEATYGRMVAYKLVDLALDGEIGAIREVIDRVEGKPKQTIDLSVEERRREFAERAIEALMSDAGIERDEAIEQLTRLAPELTTWVN